MYEKRQKLKWTLACLGSPPLCIHPSQFIPCYSMWTKPWLGSPCVLARGSRSLQKQCKLYCSYVCLPSECGCACRRVTSLPLPVGRCPRTGAVATQVTVSLGKQARPGQPGIAGLGGDYGHVGQCPKFKTSKKIYFLGCKKSQ